MKISMFQRAANRIKGWTLPDWLRDLLGVVESGLLDLGKAVTLEIRNAVVFAAEHPDWDNDAKFSYVFTRVRNIYNHIGENILGIAIKAMVASLKEKKHI